MFSHNKHQRRVCNGPCQPIFRSVLKILLFAFLFWETNCEFVFTHCKLVVFAHFAHLYVQNVNVLKIWAVPKRKHYSGWEVFQTRVYFEMTPGQLNIYLTDRSQSKLYLICKYDIIVKQQSNNPINRSCHANNQGQHIFSWKVKYLNIILLVHKVWRIKVIFKLFFNQKLV